MVGQLARFAGVGGLATLVHVLVATLAHQLGLEDVAANLIGYLSAVSVSYFGHAKLTFGVALDHRAHLARFLPVSLLGLATSSLLVWVNETLLGGNFGFAMALVVVGVPIATFLGMKFWVFAQSGAARKSDKMGFALAVALAAVIAAIFWDKMINHDLAWYLLATREWLGGEVLYRDIYEVNPPLAFYMTVPALAFADLLGLSDSHGLVVWVSLLIFVSLSWVWTILREELEFERRRAAFLVSAVAASFVIPATWSFGQREHLMVIMAMPWIIGQLGDLSTRRQLPRAIFAAVGFCLKPYFIVFPLAALVWRVARDRRIKSIFALPHLAMLGVGVAYGVYVLLVHPLYLNDVVPTAMNVYGALKIAPSEVFEAIAQPLLLVGVFAVIVALHPKIYRHAMLLMVMAGAGVVSYFWQMTGFDYHVVPFATFSIIGASFVLLNMRKAFVEPLAAAMTVGMFAVQGVLGGFYVHPIGLSAQDLSKALGEPESLMSFSTELQEGPLFALEADMTFASRYPHNWLIPGAVAALAHTDCEVAPDVCEKAREMADRNRSDNIEDILRHEPDVLLVDRNSDFFEEPNFDWYGFFEEDPRFASVIADYELALQSGYYDFWRRID